MRKILILNNLIFCLLVLAGCEVEYPEKEDVPELITKVELTFIAENGDEIVVSASDPDAEGIKGIEPSDSIRLAANTSYRMAIRLINELALPGDADYEITEEVEEEADEHRFYFEWVGDVFADPSGNGNMDVGADPVRYVDTDENGLPLGLQTTWLTNNPAIATLRIVLKHQPDGLKTSAADASVGETDVDVTFNLIID